jgi:5-methylcytosine-specific restriction protein A
MKEGKANGAAVNQALLLAPTLPASHATVEQLQERLKSTIRVQNQAAAIRAEVISELRRREGTELTENVLQEDGLLPRRRARSEIETAKELEKLPKTREGMENGDISHDNARILAGASQRGEISEEELVDAARTQSPDKFAGTVRRHEHQRSKDDGVAKLEHQRSRRYAKIKTDIDDGMTVLYGRFDPITGAQIETALSKKMNELWRKEDPGNRATPGQRMADALVKLLARRGGEDDQPQDVKLLLIADYDTVSGQVRDACLADRTPIPASELRRLACDAQILPALFKGHSQPLDLGMAKRTASPAQRTALIARDRKCVGCGAKAAWCQAHHIEHWADGGPTNLENMCLLCTRCHHKVHDDGWQVRKSPTGRYFLRKPSGGLGWRTGRKGPHRRPDMVNQRK